jgi:predicted esterase
MLRFLPALLIAGSSWAQLTPADAVFAGLSARTTQLSYQAKGGDMTPITPLLAGGYRGLTHAMVVMGGDPWTPDAELTTALDFALGSKVVGTGERLMARATFVLDAPAASGGPYRMRLELLKADGTKEASVEPGIMLGDVRGRREGEISGLSFDPSKLAQPGLHTIRATLENGSGKKLFEYYRTFWIISDLSKRMAALDKTLELLPDQSSPAALEARDVVETIRASHRMYKAPGFQELTGFVFTGMRAAGLGAKEPMDFEAGLTRATLLATSLKEGHDPTATAKGDLFLAYRSTFDAHLVPYRVYLPTSYTASKKYPLVVLLHGAGGDETDFIEAYRALWPKLAEERGYILASVNGRGPLSGYTKESGGEQDVLDVMEMVTKRYSVDTAKVYLGGHSMGGGGTWRIGLAYQDKFAGFIPIAPAGNSPALMKDLKKPVMLVCGVKDALVPVAGCRAVAAKAKELNAPVKYSEYPDGDHLSVAVMSVPDIFNWLDQQTKGSAGSGGR